NNSFIHSITQSIHTHIPVQPSILYSLPPVVVDLEECLQLGDHFELAQLVRVDVAEGERGQVGRIHSHLEFDDPLELEEVDQGEQEEIHEGDGTDDEQNSLPSFLILLLRVLCHVVLFLLRDRISVRECVRFSLQGVSPFLDSRGIHHFEVSEGEKLISHSPF
ncbi:hypothetical protein PMAYCL1PPCAC_13842, partial [Pristionchus mayeri]